MIAPDEISKILDDERIEYVRHHSEECERWLIICSIGVISVELLTSGEHLRVRTGPVVDASKLSAAARCDLYRRAMDANDEQMIGRFCGVDHVDYEIGMAFPGQSVLYPEQLTLALQTAAAVRLHRHFVSA
jgi:hypothetical protein